MTESPLIEIHNATIYRGNNRVFRNFDLKICAHEQVAILGPNGSGKTTLLKVLNREIYPVRQDDSWVRILGIENWNVWELRSRIGIVSHDLQAQYRNTTTGLSVVLSGFLSSVGIHGLLRRRINDGQVRRAKEIMHELDIATLANRPLKDMSTGQQRRCLLGRALVHDPTTLILDEPTAGLDMTASFDYLDRIHHQVKEGKSIVLVTHQLNEIPPAIERVILLRAGKIMADGPKDQVLTEENLRLTYDTQVSVTKVDGFFLAYPPASR